MEKTKTHDLLSFRRLFFIFSVLLLLCLLPCIASAEGGNRTVRVGFFAYPGYHELENDVMSGYGYEFLTLLQRYTNLNYEFIGYENSWEEMQQMLLNGEIDLVTSARKTLEREKVFDFSEPIGTNSAQLNVRQDDERFIPGDHAALDGITIGELSGNSRNADMESFAAEKGFTFLIKEYAGADELQRALRDHEVDAVVSSSLRKTSGEKTIAEFAPQDFYVIVQKGNRDLLFEINYGISQMDANEGNWRDNLYYRNYAAGSGSVLTFTQREQDYIRAVQNGEKTITVSASPDLDPYSFVNNGELTGIIPDYFAHLMEMAGLPYTVLVAKDRDEFQAREKTNYTDVVMDCRYGSSPSAEADFGLVTDAYMDLTTSRVTRKGFSGPIHSIAAAGSREAGFNEENIAGDAKYLFFSSDEEAMQAVKDGKADACYVYTYMAEKFINTDLNSSLQAKILKEPVYQEHIYVSPYTDHALCSILNKCIRSDASGILDEYVKKYTTVSFENLSLSQYLQLHPYLTLVICLVLAALILFTVAAVFRGETTKLKNAQLKKELSRLDQIKGLASQFSVLYFVNLETLETENYYLENQATPDEAKEIDRKAENFFEAFKSSMVVYAHPDYRKELLKYADPAYVKELLQKKRRHDFRFLCMNAAGEYSWTDMVLMKFSENEADEPLNIAVGYYDTDAEMKERLEAFRRNKRDLEAIRGLAGEFDTLQFADLKSDSYSLYYMTDDSPETAKEMSNEQKKFSEFYRESMLAFCHPDQLEEMLRFSDIENIREVLKYQNKYTCRFRCNSDRGYQWLEFALIRLDRDEMPNRVAVGYTNINDRVEKEKAQLIQQNRDAAVIAGLSDDFSCVVYVDYETGNEVHYRFDPLFSKSIPDWEKITVFDERVDMLGKTIVHPDDLAFFRTRAESKAQILAAIKKDGVFYHNFRVVIDGKTMYYQLKIVRDETFENRVIAGFRNVDKTVRREMEYQEQLEAANKSKSDFLFNMSHDIRTPMNAIIGFTRLAEKNIDDPERVSDCLEKIDISGNHLLNLINEVLDMSRVEAGKVHSEMKPLDILDAANRIVTICRESAEQRELHLTFQEKNIVHTVVSADELHINQIIMNIIGNSIKYTEPGGSIVYTVEEAESEKPGYAKYLFTVEDTGIGMSPEFLEHIFESFSREENALTGTVQGTGLGMAIVKRLVDYLDGTIDIASEQGKGTKVTVMLHLLLADPKELRAQTGKTVPVDLTGKKVLLVEDNELNREIAVDLLKEQGLIVEEAVNGLEAVERVRERGTDHFDFVLMDIQMPFMDGYRATGEIRKLPGAERLPIIALSANAFDEDKNKSIRAGMNDHVSKPININELFAVLCRYCGE